MRGVLTRECPDRRARALGGGTREKWDNGGMSEESTAQFESARVRRTPRYSVFLILGGAIGLVAAAIITMVFGDPAAESVTGVTYSSLQVFGFVTLWAVPLGAALSALIALIFDRAFARRAREVRVSHERIRIVDEPSAESAELGEDAAATPPAEGEQRA